MKTPEEIKKGIRQCLGFFDEFVDACDQCPYWREGSFCKGALCYDAISLIDQMESGINLNTLRDAICEDAVAHGLWEGTDYIVKECIDAAIQEGEPADQEEMMRGLAMEVIRREVNELEEASVNAEAYTDELADVIIASLSVAGKLGNRHRRGRAAQDGDQ